MNFKEFRSITAKNSDEYIDTVKKVKEAEYKADVERWSSVHESGWHRRNPEKVGSPADPDYNVLKGKGKPVKDSKPSTTGKASKQPPGIYKPNKEGKFVKVSEDSAFDNVVAKLRAQHGKDAVITKDNPPKPPTEAQKREYAAHKAKIAAQDTRDDLEKSSSGRYSRKYSNVGSD